MNNALPEWLVGIVMIVVFVIILTTTVPRQQSNLDFETTPISKVTIVAIATDDPLTWSLEFQALPPMKLYPVAGCSAMEQ